MWSIAALTNLKSPGLELGTRAGDVASGSELQRSPFVFPPTWSLAALCGPHCNTALGTRIYSSRTNYFRDCMPIHQRYVLDGAAANMNQTNQSQVISPRRSKLAFKYHADDSS